MVTENQLKKLKSINKSKAKRQGYIMDFGFSPEDYMLASNGQREVWLDLIKRRIVSLGTLERKTRTKKKLAQDLLNRLERLEELEQVQEDHVDNNVKLLNRIEELEEELKKLKG